MDKSQPDADIAAQVAKLAAEAKEKGNQYRFINLNSI